MIATFGKTEAATESIAVQWQLVLPINFAAGQTATGDTYGFLAYVETLQPDFKTDKKIVSKFDLQITGAVSFVPGS